MDENRGQVEDETTRKEMLNSIANENQKNQLNQNDRRGVLRGVVVSALSTLGFSNTANLTTAASGKSVNINKGKAREVVARNQENLRHLSKYNVLSNANTGRVVSKIYNESSVGDQIKAESYQDHKGKPQLFLTGTFEGPNGKVTLGFAINKDYSFFDLPENFDSEPMIESWNSQVSATGCPDRNDGCCCYMAECADNCSPCSRCECTTVAGTECWYQVCDCCKPPYGWCVRYCDSPTGLNCG